MFSANGITPWHHLGNIVPGKVTAAEAQALAGADFGYDLAPLHYINPMTGTRTLATGTYGIIRTDNGQHLHTVGNRYEIVQPAGIFDFFVQVSEGANVEIETAGVLNEGKTVWCLAKVAAGEVLRGDEVGKYVLMTQTLGKALRLLAVGTRVVCMNTLKAALGEGEPELRLRHTRSIHDELARAVDAVTAAGEHFHAELEKHRAMANITVDIDAFLAEVYPEREDAKRDTWSIPRLEARELYETAPGQDVARGSLYSAVNAVTRQISHGDKARSMSGDKFLSGFIDGVLAKQTERVYEVAENVLDGSLELVARRVFSAPTPGATPPAEDGGFKYMDLI